jgi:hypothetical protein
MKPNFQAMTKAELRAYVLEHREDTEAFQALADKVLDNPNLKWYPPEDAARFPEIYEAHRKRRQTEQET